MILASDRPVELPTSADLLSTGFWPSTGEPGQGLYIMAAIAWRTLRGRFARARFIAYAFVATLVAIPSDIRLMSLSGGYTAP